VTIANYSNNNNHKRSLHGTGATTTTTTTTITTTNPATVPYWASLAQDIDFPQHHRGCICDEKMMMMMMIL